MNFDFKNFFSQKKISLVLSLFLILCVTLDIINHQFSLSDFKVYYEAANYLKNHEPFYGEAFGLSSGFFKYSPFAAFLFIPFTWFNYFFAEILICIFQLFALLFVFHQLRKYFIENDKRYFLVSLLTLFICGTHLQREIHLGNVNLILVALLILVLKNIKSGKINLAAVLYALVISIKPHFIILLPLFIFRKQWKLAAISISAFLLLIIFPAIIYGWQNNWQNLIAWKQAMISHNAATEGNEQTLYYIFEHYFLRPFSAKNNIFISAFLLMILAVLFLIILLKNLRQEKINSLQNRNFRFEFFLLIGLVPNLVVTDTNHFVFALPIIFIVVEKLFNNNISKPFKFAAIFFLVLFGIKITDIIGNHLADIYLLNGMLGISNLMLIMLCWKFENDEKKLLNN